jgi:ubiquitin-protein ligase|tara:strand:+ start:610 stop:1314 length:705 start_codon:yes stop_codon:yes gene_type:complete
MPPASIKRILSKDIKAVQRNELNKNGIYVEFNENDITEAYALIIGPKDTCYEGGLLYFKINFPTNYPFAPPKVLYLSRGSIRIHPNLYTGRPNEDYLGKVCLSLLGTWSGPQWTTVMDITSVLISIQSLLTNDPIKQEPGYGNSNGPLNVKYRSCVEYETLRTLIIRNGTDPPTGYECFQEVIKNHIQENKNRLLEKYTKLSKEKTTVENVTISVYHISLRMNYSELIKVLEEL